MNRVLLDTHAFLWFVFGDPRLSEVADAAIVDPKAEKLLSVGSLWEIVIKAQLDKLRLGMTVEAFFDDHVIGRVLTVLPVEPVHLLTYSALPLHHRDPFDRLLVAQAIALKVPLISSDLTLDLYEIERVW